MITEDYCSYEVAKLLKEKGFPQEHDIYHSLVYNEEDYEDEYETQRMVLQTQFVKAGTLSSYPVSVPEPKCYCCTHQMAMKWLRKEKEIFFCVHPDYPTSRDFAIEFYDNGIPSGFFGNYKTYEDAIEAALKYSLENLI